MKETPETIDATTSQIDPLRLCKVENRVIYRCPKCYWKTLSRDTVGGVYCKDCKTKTEKSQRGNNGKEEANLHKM